MDVFPEQSQDTTTQQPEEVSILVLVDVFPEPEQQKNQNQADPEVSILVLVDVFPELQAE